MAGPPGTAYRDVMRGFEKSIRRSVSNFKDSLPRTLLSRFSKERQAGQYLWDIYVTGPTSFDVTGKRRETWILLDQC